MEYGFDLTENYNRQEVLVIDPGLDYSTFIGGDNSEYGYGIVVDSGGNTFLTGLTGSTGFPTTAGAYDTSNPGIFVLKLNPTGSSLLYSTFIGPGYSKDIQIDTSGNAYVVGHTAGTPSQ